MGTMPDEDHLKQPCGETARITRAALWMAFGIGMGSAFAGILRGGPVVRVVPLGILGSIVGLVAWWLYHRISRRNDGLAIIITAAIMPNVSSDRTDIPLWGHAICLVITTVPLACLIALVVREKKPNPPIATGAHPLSDADVDHPVSPTAL